MNERVRSFKLRSKAIFMLNVFYENTRTGTQLLVGDLTKTLNLKANMPFCSVALSQPHSPIFYTLPLSCIPNYVSRSTNTIKALH